MRENPSKPSRGRKADKRILAATDPSAFIGRTDELKRLLEHSRGADSLGLTILAAPSAGLSELLRQVYDRLFFEAPRLTPVYFEFRTSDRTARGAAYRFLKEFLLQTVAGRRRDPAIVAASPDIAEIAELAPPSDGYWVDRLVEICADYRRADDDRAFIRSCLSAPSRASRAGARTFIMFDGLDVAEDLAPDGSLIEDVNDTISRFDDPFVVGGLRRKLFAKTSFETMALEPLGFSAIGTLADAVANRTGVSITDQTRDLIAVQLGGNLTNVLSLFTAAVDRDVSFETFADVENVYTDEIFGGHIARRYDSVLAATTDGRTGSELLSLLSETLDIEFTTVPVSHWHKRSGLDPVDLERAIARLHAREVINRSSGLITIDTSDLAFCDYLRARTGLEIEREPRGLVVGRALASNIRRAPRLMSRFYRQMAALGLDELLHAFDGQQVSPALIDYGRFKNEFHGADEEKVLKALREDNERMTLPRIVYTANTGALYPRLDEIRERERSAVGIGFPDQGEKTEIVWIAAEIGAKFEASRDTAEFWCDRLEMAALHCGFENYRLWLVAPEGFTEDALALLEERNAFGSSRRQASLLARMLNAETGFASREYGASEYEITIPMGGDTEMIAAHTVEEIARRHNFPPKAVNQIKTALVEACINATEHSDSPDRKINLKFAVTRARITMTITNRGVRLVDQEMPAVQPEEGRRGWGLKLMRGLMDDVEIERSDDGTRITMTKSVEPR